MTDNQSFDAVFITGGLASGQSVTLAPIGTQTTVGCTTCIASNPDGGRGATLTIGTGATVIIQDQQTLSVSGQLNVTGASVGINKLTNNGAAYGIVVDNGGTMTVTGSTFIRYDSSNENTSITVNAGGHLIASGSTFSLDNVYLDAGSLLDAATSPTTSSTPCSGPGHRRAALDRQPEFQRRLPHRQPGERPVGDPGPDRHSDDGRTSTT